MIDKKMVANIIALVSLIASLTVSLCFKHYNPANDFVKYLYQNDINEFEMTINNSEPYILDEHGYRQYFGNESFAEIGIYEDCFSKNENVFVFSTFAYDDYSPLNNYTFNKFENRILFNHQDQFFEPIKNKIRILAGDYPQENNDCKKYIHSLLISKKMADNLLNETYKTYDLLVGNLLYASPFNHETAVVEMNETIYKSMWNSQSNYKNPYSINFISSGFGEEIAVSSNIISGVYESDYFPSNLSIASYNSFLKEQAYASKGFYFHSNKDYKNDLQSLKNLFNEYEYQISSGMIKKYWFDFTYKETNELQIMRQNLLAKKQSLDYASNIILIASISCTIVLFGSQMICDINRIKSKKQK